MFKFPLFVENSKLVKYLSYLSPIEIWAITLGPIVLCRGKINQRVRRHETIHYQQYLETFFIGFILIYLYDFLYQAIINRKGFSKEAYLSIRFEQEAYAKDDDFLYLKFRKRYAWLKYKLRE